MDPDWLEAAAEQLARFDGQQHAQKRRATVIALVDARLAGEPEESIWDRAKHPHVCSRTIYHGKWKRDPVFAEVLDAVTRLARDYRDKQALRALQKAAERLALAAPAAAEQLASIATTGRVRRVQTDGKGAPRVYTEPAAAAEVIRAVLGLLDRAGIETATKSTTEVSGDTVLRLTWGEAEMDAGQGEEQE